MISAPRLCTKCGSEIPADAPEGGCPGCLLETALDAPGGQMVFGRYKLIKVLGRGGMGIVWLARDEELERDVALKFLPNLMMQDRSTLDSLKRETKRCLELTHPHIVRIYDFVHDERSGCISMEYVDGETLSNLRAEKEHQVLEPHELAGWIAQLCEALDYAHNHAKVIHRDLKPSNLMVNKRGDLKITDFGIARSLADSASRLTAEQGRSGTLVYMSPQQLAGEHGTHLDDIYSLGVTLYDLLTSKPPFYSGNIDRQIHERVPPSMTERRKDLNIEPASMPPIWEEVVAACLQKDPAKRPQSAVEVANRLQLSSAPIRNHMDKLLGRQESTPSKLAGPKDPATPVKPTQTTQSRPAIPPVAKEPAVWRRKRLIIVTAVAATVIVLLAIPGLITGPANDYAEAMKLATGLGGTRIDLPKAAEHLQRAAAKNVPEAEARLAYWINNGVGGLARDNVKAEQWAKKALADGLAAKAANSAEAQTELATLYEFGLGAPKDLEKAAQLYQKAAHQGNQDAIANLKRISKPPAAFPPGIGGIKINTAPSGATVTLGGFGTKKTPTTFNANTGKYSLFIELDGNEPIAREVEVKEGQLSDLGTITLQPGKSRIDLSSAPPGAKIFQGDILLGVTPFRRDDFPSGRTTFLLVSEGYLPREFTARLDSKELFKATIPLAKPLSVYKGTIGGSVPITIKLGADLKSGTMAQSSTRGETVVKFAGVWTGATLRAVTQELLSKPESILWERESFTLRFSDDGKNGAYECNYGTEVFTASLGAP